MSRASLMILATAHILISGCAPLPPVPPPDAPVQQCLVCRHKRDFACLEVEKTPGTPHTRLGGRDYWFCGEICRCEFEKHPEPFLPKP